MTTIISFDVEKNGFRGATLAFGGCVIASDGTVSERNAWRCVQKRSAITDPWCIKANLWSHIEALPYMPRERFYRLAMTWLSMAMNKHKGAHVVIDCGHPVETGFLLECAREVGADMPTIYPVHEVASLLLAAGIDPDINRVVFASAIVQHDPALAHNPLFDAQVSGLCALHALRLCEKQVQLVELHRASADAWRAAWSARVEHPTNYVMHNETLFHAQAIGRMMRAPHEVSEASPYPHGTRTDDRLAIVNATSWASTWCRLPRGHVGPCVVWMNRQHYQSAQHLGFSAECAHPSAMHSTLACVEFKGHSGAHRYGFREPGREWLASFLSDNTPRST